MSQFFQQNPLLKEFAIAGAVVLVLIVVQIPLSIRRRVKRHEARAAARADQARPGGAPPVDGLDALAATQGWTGPTTDPGFSNQIVDYAHEMLRNLWGHPRSQDRDSHGIAIDPNNIYTNIFHGTVDGHAFTIGNTRLNVVPYGHVADKHDADHQASICVVKLPMTLPPLYVNLHRCVGYRGLGLHHVDLESEEFNRTFDVEGVDPKYAVDVITPQVMEVLLTRRDWTFGYVLDSLVCLCATGLHDAAAYQERLRAVSELVSLIPGFVAEDDALQLPTLPDGTVLGPDMSEADQQRAMAAVMAMSPEDRLAFARKAGVDGLESAAKMFGKHLDPALLEAAVDKNLARMQAEHPEAFGPQPSAPGQAAAAEPPPAPS